jgi:hypothetical protein
VLSAPSAPASASAAGASAWEAAAGTAAQGQAGEASVLLQPLAGVGLMDAGPLPAESYAAFGHVAGLQNPEALRRHPHLPSLYGCESTDAECAAESRCVCGSLRLSGGWGLVGARLGYYPAASDSVPRGVTRRAPHQPTICGGARNRRRRKLRNATQAQPGRGGIRR